MKTQHTNLDKRNFLKLSAVASATLPLFSIGAPKGSEIEQLRVGCIGMGRMMRGHLRGFLARCKVVAVCDVDTTRREDALNQVHDHYGNKDCKGYVDYREILARDDVDVVCIATPDHWHARITMDAARAGKDIYCEKPLTHDIDEAIQVMDVIKKSDVVMATGSQQRGMREFRVAAELVRNEIAGKVLSIKSNFWGPGRTCDLGTEELEPGLDWNMWCGPAPLRGYNSTLSPRGIHTHFPQWRAFKEYGGGGVCDMGAHHLDIIQWALDMDQSGPVKALPNAANDRGEGAKLIYANGIEVERTKGYHVDFICENGRISASRGKFRFELDGKVVHQFVDKSDGSIGRATVLTEREFLEGAKTRLPQQKKGGFQQNFLDNVVSRGKPLAHVEAGARSAICCHLMNLSYYHQQPIHWDPIKLKFSDKSCDPAWLKGSRRDWESA